MARIKINWANGNIDSSDISRVKELPLIKVVKDNKEFYIAEYQYDDYIIEYFDWKGYNQVAKLKDFDSTLHNLLRKKLNIKPITKEHQLMATQLCEHNIVKMKPSSLPGDLQKRFPRLKTTAISFKKNNRRDYFIVFDKPTDTEHGIEVLDKVELFNLLKYGNVNVVYSTMNESELEEELTTITKGSIVKVEGIPVKLEQDTKVSGSAGNLNIIRKVVKEELVSVLGEIKDELNESMPNFVTDDKWKYSKNGGVPTCLVGFSFDYHPWGSDYRLEKDGWFRRESGVAKGFGLMFRKVKLLTPDKSKGDFTVRKIAFYRYDDQSTPTTDENGATKFNTPEDIPANWTKEYGWLWVYKEYDIDEVVKWMNTQQHNWVP